MNNRKIYLDFLRILACFLVIVNHTTGQIFLNTQPSPTWFISLTYFFISKIAVPIFLMISGALLLKKEEKYSVVILNRILKIVFVILVFSLMYYINEHGLKAFSVTIFIEKIYYNPITNAFWYLYMYLGLMIMLPIIRKIVSSFNQNDSNYYIIAWIFFIGVLPLINNVMNISMMSAHFEIPLFTKYLGYFIAGYIIDNYFDKLNNKKYTIISAVISVICVMYNVFYTYKDYILTNTMTMFMDNTAFITIMIPSLTIFLIFKRLFHNIEINTSVYKVISLVSSCTFGIYLFSDYFIVKLSYIYSTWIKYTNPIIAVLVLELSVFLFGLIITLLLKKIKYIKNLI